jgi:hypothetical protein
MAQKNRADILALINAYTAKTDNFITTNGNREISGAKLNEILNDNGDLLNDIKDSYYSLLDDLANAVNYTPTVPADWNATIPTEVKGGLDQLAERLRGFETNNASQNTVFVAKTGSDTIGEYEIGNPLKPFLTIQAALNSMPINNSILKVLGGGTYSEFSGGIIFPQNHTNCLYDFGNTTFNGTFTANFSTLEFNNNIIQNVFITGNTSTVSIGSTFLVRCFISGNQVYNIDSKFCQNCSFISSNSVNTFSSNTTYLTYLDTCTIRNTSVTTGGRAVYRSPRTIFNNCFIESSMDNTTNGFAISSEPATDTIQEVIRLYNCVVKSVGTTVGGENGVANLIAYNTKFYSSNREVLRNGGTSFGRFLLFEGCEFYTKLANNSVVLSGTLTINRTSTQNYTFKNCTFHTVTGYPLGEPISYNSGDLGTTLFVNCVATATAMTSIAPVKVTEHNSFFFTNYTDFNTLQ